MKRMKERDRESEKAPEPDRLKVICPLIFMLTHLAVNYDLAWQPETKITVEDDQGFTVEDVTGVYKSNPVLRGHTEAFQRELQRMREANQISWNESAYYFTFSEGVAAREAYEKEVLEGRLKAHITSWGPNPNKADDKSRFHRFTGVTFEELKEKYPELYSRKTATVAKPEPEKKDSVTISKKEMEVKEEVEEPSKSELKEIEKEEKVAAATATDETIEDLIESPIDEEQDDHETLVLYVPVDIASERIDVRNESISWKSSDGKEMQAYLMEVPEVETGLEMWLPVGKWNINGYKYEVRIEDKE